MMDAIKLETHIKLCKRNLKSSRVKCCGNCPFEEEIIGAYPELALSFEAKRKQAAHRYRLQKEKA